MAEEPTFREQAYQRIRAALGRPEISTVASGDLYRWTLCRAPYEINLYVTMDSPEHPQLAHIMISDGPRYQPEPVISFTACTVAEVDDVIKRILTQWRAPRRP